MGVIVNFIEEVKSRIETATNSGNDLFGVKSVQIGSREEARNFESLPIILIDFKGGSGEAVYKRNGNTDDVELSIKLVIPKKEGAGTNALYNSSSETGSVYMLEKLLNVLDKNTSGSVDLTFNGTIGNLRNYSYSIDQANDLVVIDVTLSAKTIYYQLGSR